MSETSLNLLKDIEQLSKNQDQVQRSKRPRSATMLKLQWLAERVRRCEQIKKAVAEGTYRVDSRSVAQAIVNLDAKPRERD